MPRPSGKKAANPFDSDSGDEFVLKPKRGSSSSTLLENKSVQELGSFAKNEAEKVTQKVNNCLRIAETIKDDASTTLVTLYHQGEKINRTGQAIVEIDKDLTKSEKLLGSLGGWFSKPWKPTKSHRIKGSVLIEDNSYLKKEKRKQKREKLGLSQKDSKHQQYAEPTSVLEEVEVEMRKQDDTIDGLSDVLGQLKGMAVDMCTEIDRQNIALDVMGDDINELNSRVKGANQRACRLVR